MYSAPSRPLLTRSPRSTPLGREQMKCTSWGQEEARGGDLEATEPSTCWVHQLAMSLALGRGRVKKPEGRSSSRSPSVRMVRSGGQRSLLWCLLPAQSARRRRKRRHLLSQKLSFHVLNASNTIHILNLKIQILFNSKLLIYKHICTMIYKIVNKDLLYSTGSYVQYVVVT